jgi:hypothetical protein
VRFVDIDVHANGAIQYPAASNISDTVTPAQAAFFTGAYVPGRAIVTTCCPALTCASS